MRSEVFGDLTFVDHAEIPLDNQYKFKFLIIYDGATQLMTSFPCEKKSDGETIDLLLDYFDLCISLVPHCWRSRILRDRT